MKRSRKSRLNLKHIERWADFQIIYLTFEIVIVRKLSRFLIHICRDVHSRPSKCRIWRSVVLSHLINITDKMLLKTFKKNRYITSPSMCLSLFWLNWYENELFGHNSPYYLNTIWKLNNLVCSKTLFTYLDANQCKWCIRFLKIVTYLDCGTKQCRNVTFSHTLKIQFYFYLYLLPRGCNKPVK